MSKADERPLAECWLERLCDVSAATGGIVLVSIACITVISVLGRALFAKPILGDIELVQLGAAVVVACFLPYTQFQRANIIVDFFTVKSSAQTKNYLDGLGCFLYTLVLILIVWRVAIGGVDIRTAGEMSMLMNIPLWIPYFLMLPGLVLCVLISAYQTLRHLDHALRGRA